MRSAITSSSPPAPDRPARSWRTRQGAEVALRVETRQRAGLGDQLGLPRLDDDLATDGGEQDGAAEDPRQALAEQVQIAAAGHDLEQRAQRLVTAGQQAGLIVEHGLEHLADHVVERDLAGQLDDGQPAVVSLVEHAGRLQSGIGSTRPPVSQHT